MLEILSALVNAPFSVRWTENTPKLVLFISILYPMAVFYYISEQADLRPGAEYGTARWGNVKALDEKYRNRKNPSNNFIFTQHIQMGTDSFRHQHNLNVMVIGGSGSGKTRYYVKPNLLQCECSYIILDSKGEISRDLGGMFEAQGIAVTVIDLVHFRGHYNPLVYLENDEDAIKLAHAIVHNTKPKDAVGSADKFWDDSSMMLLSAIILYLLYEAPVEEQNLSTVMYMIINGQVSEDDSYGRNIKYAKLRPKGSPRAIRFKSLGPGYSEQELRERLEQPKSDTGSRRGQREQAVPLVHKKIRFHGSYRKQDHKKITGFMALYYHYLYLFGKVQKRRTSSRKTHFLLWEDFRTFERYKQQAQFLWQNRIQTTDDLHQKRQEVTAKMDGLAARRQALYKLRSNTANGLNKADLSRQIQALTEELRGLRKELRYCDAIEQDAEHLRKQVETIRCTEQEAKHQKQRREREHHEHWR